MIEQNREPRNKPTDLLTKVAGRHNGKRKSIVSSTNGAGRTGYSHAKKKKKKKKKESDPYLIPCSKINSKLKT